MNEYIRKEPIIKELEEEIAMCDKFDEKDVLINKGLELAIKAINRQPTTDAQPVRFARWIDLDNRILCSGCGAGYDDCNEVKRNTYIFCPNCGARIIK